VPYQLMNWRHVPEDEMVEVRELLASHGIDYYETPPSFWGISEGGVWVRDEDEALWARQVLAEYSARRQQEQRRIYEEKRRSRQLPGLATRLAQAPLRSLLLIAALGAVLYLSLVPFLSWG